MIYCVLSVTDRVAGAMIQSVNICNQERVSIFTLLELFSALLAGYFVWFSITDSDLFWHLASGKEMVARRAVLLSDPFSYTRPDAPWTNLHWLFQLIVYGIEQCGGLRLLQLFKSVSMALSLGCIAAVFPRSFRTAALLQFVAIIVYHQRYLVPMRPIVITLFLCGLFIASLERYFRSGNRIWLLPPLIGQLLWVNSQGLFMLGWAIAASYAIGEALNLFASHRLPGLFSSSVAPPANRLKFAAMLPFVLIAVSLINPCGIGAFSSALRLFYRIRPLSSNIYAHAITENTPLVQMIGTAYGQYAGAVLAVAVVLTVSICFCRSRIRFSHIALAAIGFVLAVMAQRNGILFTILATPALLWNSHYASFPVLKKGLVCATRYTVMALLVSITIMASISHAAVLHFWPDPLSPFSHPTEIARLLHANPVKGNIFNADRYGGYLLWKLYPACRVSHDTRLTLRNDEYFNEYISLIDNPSGFNDYAFKWNITHVALPMAPIDRYLPLAAELYRDPHWKLAFTDGTEILFVADTVSSYRALSIDSGATVDSVVSLLQKRYKNSSAVRAEAQMWLGRLCAAVGAFNSGLRAVENCDGIACHTVRAAIREQQGFLDEAELVLRSIVREHPGNSDARLQLVLFYLRNGRRNRAMEELRALLTKDPFNAGGRNLLFKFANRAKG